MRYAVALGLLGLVCGGASRPSAATRMYARDTPTQAKAEPQVVRARVTDLVGQSEAAEPRPAMPKLFPDVNGDGKLTLCVVGDSIMNETPFYDALNGMAEEPDNILRCAHGGRVIGQVAATWTATLNGQSDAPCAPERGVNEKCDVAFMHIGANDFAKYQQMTHDGFCMQRGCVGGGANGQACATNTECPGGTCTDFRGPQQGGQCTLPFGTKTGGPANNGQPARCIAGPNIARCCAGLGCASPLACTGEPAGCVNGTAPGSSCTIGGAACAGGGTCTPWAAQPVAGQLGGNGSNDLLDPVYPPTWCVPGAADAANCPKGLCLHQTTRAYMTAATQQLIDAAAARTGPDAVRLVLVGNTDPCIHPITACVGGINTGAGCSSDANCPGGACRVPNAQAGWSAAVDDYRWYATWLRATAESQGLPFIDFGAYQRRISSDPDENVRDCIHQSADKGQPRMAAAATACIERDTSVPENKCGDLSGPTCPATIPATNTATQTNLGDVILASDNCTPSTTEHVDAITAYVTAATAGTHLRASIYRFDDVTHTLTKLDAGCDAIGTFRGGAQWLTMPTATPASCALAAGTSYFIGVIPESNSATFPWATKSGGGRFKTSVPYSGGMPARVTGVSSANANYAVYLNVHMP